MAITYEYPVTLSREDFDRLFNEATAKIDIEKIRLGGESALREALWSKYVQVDPQTGEPFYQTGVYKLDDGYIVGAWCGCKRFAGDDGLYWYHFAQPTWGQDRNGSRSWFYDEDTRKMFRQFVIDQGCVGALAIHNPDSPAATAIKSHFSNSWDGRQYWEDPTIHTIEEVYGEGVIGNVTDSMRCMKVRIIPD